MTKSIDITGRKFGRLTALEMHSRDIHNTQLWKFKCDCGKEVVIKKSYVLHNNTKSCGCLHIEVATERAIKQAEKNKLPLGECSRNALFYKYKRAAGLNDREFKLSMEDFVRITKSNCEYCGVAPNRKYLHTANANSYYEYNGIDRTDNSKGYTLDNVVPCCADCNKAKHILSKDAFLDLVKRVYKHTFGGRNG
jgi:hypothetical protein